MLNPSLRAATKGAGTWLPDAKYGRAFDAVVRVMVAGGKAEEAKLDDAVERFAAVARAAPEDAVPTATVAFAANLAIDEAIARRDVPQAVALAMLFWERTVDEWTNQESDCETYGVGNVIEKYLEAINAEPGVLALPTVDELRAFGAEDASNVAEVLNGALNADPSPARHNDEATLRRLVDIAVAFPALRAKEAHLGSGLEKRLVMAMSSPHAAIANAGLNGLVALGRVQKPHAAQFKKALAAGAVQPLPTVFLVGAMGASDVVAAIRDATQLKVDTDAEKRAAILRALTDAKVRGRVADALGISDATLGAFLIAGGGQSGWTLKPFVTRGVVFPAETLLAGIHLEEDGTIKSAALIAHPAIQPSTLNRVAAFVANKEYLPPMNIQFADQVVPAQSQKHLVGRSKVVTGDAVLRLYAAATAQPKWLAHEELLHHHPREAVVTAIGEFVGLEPDEVKRYFKEGGWGRLFSHASREPLVFVDTPVQAGQIVSEYLQVAGTAAPNALDDFLKAQSETPQKDAAGKVVPFPVSDTALDIVFAQLKAKLALDFKDKDDPTDLGREQMHESKAKASLKEWFENRYFFTGERITLKPALAAPKIEGGIPAQAVAQESFENNAKGLAALIAKGDMAAALEHDAYSRAMLPAVPGPGDVVALKDGSLKLRGFLELVGKHCKSTKQVAKNVLSVDEDVLTLIRDYLRNTQDIVPRAKVPEAAPAAEPAPAQDPVQRLRDMGAAPDAIEMTEQLMRLGAAEAARRDAGEEPLGLGLNCLLYGNPGTGKTTTAREMLAAVRSFKLLPEPKDKSTTEDMLEITGGELMTLARQAGELEKFFLEKAHGRGVLLDEMFDIDPVTDEGKTIIRLLKKVLEDKRTDTIIFGAGYAEEMEAWFRKVDAGLRSRFLEKPAQFPDFADDKLREVLERKLNEKGFAAAPDVLNRVVARLGRLRGKSFGNGRACRTMVEQAMLRKIGRGGAPSGALEASDFFPDPKLALAKPSVGRKRLEGRIGLGAVKKRVEDIDDALLENADREALGMKPLRQSYHFTFVGNPGTGKTNVAADYGLFLKERGIISKGEVLRVTVEDLIGSHEGDTERKVKELLDRAKGCVLFIDEAYLLMDSAYGRKVLDMVVAALKDDGTDDIVVGLAGYTARMDAMFVGANAGLAGRFSQRFVFEDYTDAELAQIIAAAAPENDIDVDKAAIAAMIDQLGRDRMRPNFRNAGAALKLLMTVGEVAASRRRKADKDGAVNRAGWTDDQERAWRRRVTVDDVNEAVALLKRRDAAEQRALDDLIGVHPAQAWRRALRFAAEGEKRRGAKPPPAPALVPITGPKGCGKSAVARCIATELTELGMLGRAKTTEIAAGALIDKYVNATPEKVTAALNSALGGVLFVRQAHKLLDNDPTAVAQAVDTLRDFLAQNRGKITVVLEGDEDGARLDALLRMIDLGASSSKVIHLQEASGPDVSARFARLLAGDGSDNPELTMTADAMATLDEALAALRVAPGFQSFEDATTLFEGAKRACSVRLGEASERGEPVTDQDYFIITAKDVIEAATEMLALRGADEAAIEVRVPLQANGTYRTTGIVNGEVGEFIVDTGASLVSITPQFADRCGIDVRAARKQRVQTASGNDAAIEVTLPELRIGEIVARNVRALVSASPQMLLGNSFLNAIDYRKVGNELVLGGALGNGAQHALDAARAPLQAAAPRLELAPAPPRMAERTVAKQTVRAAPAAKAAQEVAAAPAQKRHAVVNDLVYREMQRLVEGRLVAVARKDTASLKRLQKEIDALAAGMKSGALPPHLLKKIAEELKVKSDEAKQIATEVATAQAEAEAQAEAIRKQLAKKRVSTEWVCSMCGNSNPGCPYNAKNNGLGRNVGGFYREVKA